MCPEWDCWEEVPLGSASEAKAVAKDLSLHTCHLSEDIPSPPAPCSVPVGPQERGPGIALSL